MSSPDVALHRDVGPDAPGVPPALRATGLRRRFGEVVAVDDVDVTLAAGEILALVGPSGCGKSTLLRLVTGLVTPDAGRIELGGTEVHGPRVSLPPERRRVGVVFQDHSLFPHLTVRDNVAFGLRGRGAGERRARVHEVLALVDLPAHADRYPHELSGGERQRVGLARALAPEPAVVLLDEPFASLDPNLRSRIRTDTVAILHEAGAAALLVTHDQVEAMAMGDRVAVMHSGRLLQVDEPEEVYTHPSSRFVATFLGTADFLPATRVGDHLDTEAGPCPLPRGDAEGDVMVRPHEVVVTTEADGNAVVVGSEFQGAHVLYDLRLDSGRRLRALLPHTVHLAPDTRVRATLQHGHSPAVLP
jgi:iron(III) transport system ATP-binding protein